MLMSSNTFKKLIRHKILRRAKTNMIKSFFKSYIPYSLSKLHQDIFYPSSFLPSVARGGERRKRKRKKSPLSHDPPPPSLFLFFRQKGKKGKNGFLLPRLHRVFWETFAKVFVCENFGQVFQNTQPSIPQYFKHILCTPSTITSFHMNVISLSKNVKKEVQLFL